MFVPLPDGGTRRTSYSIASSPRESSFFELCVTRVDGGESSEYLHKLGVGDRTQALGPLGSFLFVEDGRDSVFVATGSGIAPFRAMIPERLELGGREAFYLLFGNRTEDDILYRAEWEALAREHPNFKVLHTLSRGAWGGPRGYVQDHVQSFVPDPASKNFYLCGLKAMTSSVEAKLLALGVPGDRIRFERFD
jgi:ferredoxin-NADP reductase